VRPAGVLKLNARKGVNRVHFQGRLSKTKKLAPGAYTLQVIATNAARQTTSTRH
jgi:flagellar hook assembly protein FlgD